jgi:hypothetical protein
MNPFWTPAPACMVVYAKSYPSYIASYPPLSPQGKDTIYPTLPYTHYTLLYTFIIYFFIIWLCKVVSVMALYGSYMVLHRRTPISNPYGTHMRPFARPCFFSHMNSQKRFS